MTLLFFDSFDHYDNASWPAKWSLLNPLYVTITPNGRYGTNSAQIFFNLGSECYAETPQFTASTTVIVGFALKFFDITQIGLPFYPKFKSTGGNIECLITLNATTKKLELWRGNKITLLDTGTMVLQQDVWYFIEVKLYVHDSNGTCEVNINGVNDIDYGPGDTLSVSDQITSLLMGGSNNPPDYYFDDLYICNDQGSKNNDFLGDIRVEALFPDGAGTNTDWIPSAGNNWECVNETPPNDDTDYVHTTISGNYDTYNFDDLTTISGEVFGVSLYTYARKIDAGTKFMRLAIRPDSTNYDGNNLHSLSDTYRYYNEIMETNPETTSGWTISEINDAEFGIKSEG